ncbi:GNVR domain-containing protein, partial [Acinetobacter baumannii]
IGEQQKDMSEFSPIEQQQSRLEKEVTTAREYYDAFQRRYDNAVTSQSLGQFEAPDRVKVIDPAQDPTIPSSPPKIIFVIAGIVGGMVLGIGLAVVA